MTPTPPSSPQRRSAWRRRWVLLSALCVLLVAAAAALLYTKREHIVVGAEAYLFGYPLVIMDVTRIHSAHTFAPENELYRVRKFPDASFKGVVRPNVDTLYTNAFIDMNQGPWVFEMAANAQRYELMPFIDAWTNVFAAPGTRTTGPSGGRFLLVGPHWQGTPPDGLTLLRAPTRIVWLVGRTQTNGASDYPLVHRLQDGLSLRRLAEGANAATRGPAPAPATVPTTTPRPVTAAAAATTTHADSPVQQMQAMATDDFFARLTAAMVDNPPAAADAPMVTKMARIGLAPGQAPQWSFLERWAVKLGRRIADFKIAQQINAPRDLVRGWSTPPMILGQYGTQYNLRAVVAMVGLGANLPADATYPNAQVDHRGDALNGSHRYRLHFAANALPPVKAFWSVTAYGADDFLIDNPLQRFALGDRDRLSYNADGSLDLWIQADAPPADKLSNWLPVKVGERFRLNARLYWPRDEALDGRWGMPAVERID